MNRAEYMRRLEYRLRKLPKEEYEKAISYFIEYFEDAGIENESQAIEDLGTPEMAADQIIREFAVKNAKAPVKDVKHGVSAIWIGILAVFAAPFALPFAAMLGVLGIMLVLVVLILIFCVFLMTISVAVSSIPCIVIGVWMLFISFADGLATLGMGFIGLGIGILLVMGSIALGRGALHMTTRLFGKIAKGGRQHE